MERKNLLVAGGLTGGIIVLVIWVVIFVLPVVDIIIDGSVAPATFDNSTPQATAISIARLNEGMAGFDSSFSDRIVNVSLTSDGKYWIVNIRKYVDREYGDRKLIVTIDAKTLMSKRNGWEETEDTWRSLDELKASYIAEIQSVNIAVIQSVGTAYFERPYKVTREGKTVWKVPIRYTNDENQEFLDYVYADVATGKSKNTWDEFNKFAGTDGWLTLKQVDDTINKIQKETDASFGIPTLNPPFKDALRDLYPE
jgi:hypothetical protein